MINPWILLGLVVTWIGTLVGAYVYGDHVGTATDKAAWQGQQIAELKVANAEIDRLNKAARAQEQSQAAQLAVVAANYEKEISDVQDDADRKLAAVRSGAIKLRDPGAVVHACPSSVPGTAPAPSGRDDSASGGLSDQLTEFLIGEAKRADRNTQQLAACQAVVQTYTKGTP